MSGSEGAVRAAWLEQRRVEGSHGGSMEGKGTEDLPISV